jgi:uncharacterized membrane protein YsdA (DUF1294 family)
VWQLSSAAEAFSSFSFLSSFGVIMNYTYLLFIYLSVISLISVIVTVLDKKRAKTHKWRVKESTLLLLSLLGGSLAMFMTMQIIRHKTQKPKFMILIPCMIVIQAMLLWWVICYFRQIS